MTGMALPAARDALLDFQKEKEAMARRAANFDPKAAAEHALSGDVILPQDAVDAMAAPCADRHNLRRSHPHAAANRGLAGNPCRGAGRHPRSRARAQPATAGLARHHQARSGYASLYERQKPDE